MPMEDKRFIFLAGLHRSGTSLLHEIMREHPEISGFSDTGVPEDEGQHLQSVYEPAKVFGGPGRFAFDERAYMDESHPLATPESADKIFAEWRQHYDLSRPYLIEKSPPNIVRTRFIQKLYPSSTFIAILRHPLAVCYATKKWSKTSIASLLDHTLLAYEVFRKDMPALERVYVLRYEELVLEPQKTLDDIFSYLGLAPIKLNRPVRADLNRKYFAKWEADQKRLFRFDLRKLPERFEERAKAFGYSLVDAERLSPLPWLGARHQAAPTAFAQASPRPE
jgi:hypothetical protein